MYVGPIFPNKKETTPGVREAPHAIESNTKSLNSPPIVPGGCHQCGGSASHPGTDAADETSAQRSKYFFEDGNVTFSVDGILYRVHRYLFRHSAYFSTQFSQLDTCGHGVLSAIIPLNDIKREDFDAFLSVLYPEDFGVIDLSYEEWQSVLHLSTLWAFASLRKWVLNFMVPPTPHDQLLLARTYSVDHWVFPALSALCERRTTLSLNEARKMKLEDIVVVANVREDIRSPILRVPADEIPRRVEVAQAKILADVEDAGLPPAGTTNRTAEQAKSLVVLKQGVQEEGTPESDGERREKPDNLLPVDGFGLQPRDTSHVMSQGGSYRSSASSSTSVPDNTQSASIGLGFLLGSTGNGTSTGSELDYSSTSAAEMSSEEHFFDAPSGHASPPLMPSTNWPTSLSANARSFARGKKITIKNPSGQVVNLRDLVKRPPAPTIPPSLPSPASVAKRNIKRKPVLIESEEQKEKRLAEEREKEEASRPEIEERERKAEEDRKAKDEAERVEKERKEPEARALREEAEKAKERACEREDLEKERLRLEEEAHAQREAQEKAEKERAEQEELHKVREEEEARAKEAEGQHKAENNAVGASEDAHALADGELTFLPEEGKIEDQVSQPAADKTEELASSNKTDPTSPLSPPPAPYVPAESPSKCFEDFQTTINTNVVPLLPSALPTARFIEDINSITYPQGIKGPKVGLNVNTAKGKFFYDREFLLQFMNVCKEKPHNLPPLDVFWMEPRNTASQGSTGRNRTRTRRRRNANESSCPEIVGNVGHTAPISTISPPMEPVTPQEVSANRWVATSTGHESSGLDSESPEMVERKVKALLNKLTMMHFESISDQIITWANKSEKEKDGRTLIQVIKLIFDAVTDEATLPEIYARLCRKMMERISHNVQDDSIKNAEGKPLAGGLLFRKCLLARCQEDFERDWVDEETAITAAATRVSEVQAIEKTEGGEGPELYSDDFYAAAKAKRRGMGLIRFIGELFKLQMLTERIVHQCIRKLLGNVESPDEEEIESVCKLLTTVGSQLDKSESWEHIDVYFSRMQDLLKNKNVKPRMKFMVQDVIELRERRWVPRNTITAAMTIAQVHQVIAKAKLLAQETEYDSGTEPNSSMFRSGSRRGGNRDAVQAGSSPSTRQPPKAGDLSQFGNINKAKPIFSGSVNLGAENPSSPASWRRKPKLLPQPKRVEVATSAGREATPDDGEAEAKAQIGEDAREFFHVRMLDEAEGYFSRLPVEYRRWLVEALVMKSIEMKDSDVTLVSDLFVRVREKDLCGPGAFEEGFNRLAELVDDMAIGIPKVWSYFAILLKAAGLDQDEERCGRIAKKTQNSDKLIRVL